MPFCKYMLFDEMKSWNASRPESSPCAENTILTYIPALFLWLVVGYHLYVPPRFTKPPLPLNPLNVTKRAMTVLLMVIYIATIIGRMAEDNLTIANMLGSLIKAFNCMFVLYKFIVDARRGCQTSMVLFIYFTIFATFELPAYIRITFGTFLPPKHPAYPVTTTDFFSATTTYPMIIAMLILTIVSERRPGQEKECPIEHASPLSTAFFQWVTPKVFQAYLSPLTSARLFPLPRELESKECYIIYERIVPKMAIEVPQEEDEIVNENTTIKNKKAQEKRPPQINLLKTILRITWSRLAVSMLGLILYDTLRGLPVICLDQIMNFMGTQNYYWQGYFFATVIYLDVVIVACIIRRCDYVLILTGLQAKAMLCEAIYRKSLVVSNSVLSRYTVGELVNLIAVDSDKITQFAAYLGIAMSAPYNIAFTTTILWHFIGISSCASLTIMCLMLPMTVWIVQRCRTIQGDQMKLKDTRLKFMNEILSSIKVLKFYTWELPFTKRVEDTREKEVQLLRKYALLAAGLRFIWTSLPFMTTFLSITFYVLLNQLTAIKANAAFVTLALINTIKFSVTVIPDLLSNAVQTYVALKRIELFLNADELNENIVGHNPDPNMAISIKNVTAKWGGKDILKDINLNVEKGRLIAVVGKVGCGKTSLLSLLLGDMLVTNGTIDLDGRVAYVPQKPWVLNDTIEKNIQFVAPEDRRFYLAVLHKCSLITDIRGQPAGDRTEIGERGGNLSGGQRQRLNIARAVYQDCDIYLFDDPLSAVDSHVTKEIFNNVIGPNGLLRQKTRILCTNNMSVLHNVERIYVMSDGRIIEQGSYRELISMKGEFARLASSELEEHETHPAVQACTRRTSLCIDPNKEKFRTPSATHLLFTEYSEFEYSQINVANGQKLIQDEGMEVGSIKLKVYFNYIKYMGVLFFIFIISTFALSRLCDLIAGKWLSSWSSLRNLPLSSPKGKAQRDLRLGVYFSLGVFQGMLAFIATVSMAIGAISAASKLHSNMLNAIIRTPMSFFDTTPLGRILNRFGKDMDQLDIQLPVIATLFFEILFQVVGVMCLIIIALPEFVIFALPTMAVYYVVQKMYLNALRQLKRLESVTRSPVYNHFSETLDGLSVIRCHNAQERFIDKCRAKVDITQNCSFSLMLVRNWMTVNLNVIGGFLIYVVMMMIISRRNEIEPGMAGFLVTYMLGSTHAFNFLIHFAAEAQTAIVSSERLEEYAAVKPEAPWDIKATTPPPSWPEKGHIQIVQFCTRYRENLDLVLKGINLEFFPAQKIGVVGRTGAGKSSLTLCLFRIIEAVEGAIFIDNIDISKLGLHALRSKITIIPQEPILFSGTLRINMDPLNEYTDDQIFDALDAAGIKNEFPNGLDTLVEEGGSNISVGQRQLLCLARAVLKHTKLLVLDEATAAMDSRTDALMQEVIRRLFKDSTTITIAHRLNTIIDSDRIVVMAHGLVVEDAPPAKLLANMESEFYSMAREAGLVQ